ncbi:MAG: GNAT family N-acetyltransferase [Lachnotalea sp.]
MNPKMILRKVKEEDIDLLFNWANDFEYRKNSFYFEKIEYSVHQKWFFLKLKDENCKMYLGLCDNEYIGQIRIDILENTGTISYSISKEHRGNGYSYGILSLAEDEIKKIDCIKYLEGKVKHDNKASQKVFIKSGYMLEIHKDYNLYRKEI